MSDNKYLLEVENINKSFPGVQALQNVSFKLKPGEVHALVGENGAGKSTLIKIIAGVIREDSGVIKVRDSVEEIRDSHYARELGIGVIFQELSLVSSLSVAENVYLGNELVKPPFRLDRKTMFRKTTDLLEKYGIDLNPRDYVDDLSMARQQLTEIVKALSLAPDIVIMDEPTSSLTDAESKILFEIIEGLKKLGKGIIYVSHRMDEIFQIADRVTVLRDGLLVDDVPIDDLNIDKVVKLMVGKEVELYKFSAKSKDFVENLPVKMEVKHLYSKGKFSDISFRLKKGEILGIAGLVGSGRSEVVRSLFGVDRYDEGEIHLNGKKVSINSVEDAIDLRIALLPESRKLQGLVLMHNISDNITLPILKRFVSKIGFLNFNKLGQFAETQVMDFGIKPGNIMMLTENLSGGNQQKVCISKWLSTNPEVLIVDEPTNGIDVRTKSEIHKLLRTLADKGVSIIMVSSEMQELIAHSDRVMILNAGKSLGTFYNQDISREIIMSHIMEDIVQNSKKGISINE